MATTSTLLGSRVVRATPEPLSNYAERGAVVELDEEVLLNGEWPDFGSGSRKEVGSQRTPKGRWLALAFGWVGDVWSSPTGRLHVGLCSDKPKLRSVPLGGGIGAWVESHATMQHLGAPRDD